MDGCGKAIIRQREKDNHMAKFSSEKQLIRKVRYHSQVTIRVLIVRFFEIEEDDDEYTESGEVREMSELTSEQMTDEQREFVQKEDYLVFECRKSRPGHFGE